MLFMNINASLEILCAPIVAHKNLEGKNPENSYFQFFVMTSLWCRIFEIVLKCLFSPSIWAYSAKVWSPLHILVKNRSSSK